jgi:hypothetical protein
MCASFFFCYCFIRDLVDQLPGEGEAGSDLSNPHVLYRKVIEYVGAADQLASLRQEVGTNLPRTYRSRMVHIETAW